MSSSSRKRKTPSPMAGSGRSRDAAHEEEAGPKKKLFLKEEGEENVGVTEEIDNTVLNRPLLNVSLKRIGKRHHGILEKAEESGADAGGSEKRETQTTPLPRKVPALVASPHHSPSYASSRHITSPAPLTMASNLRASSRGANGGVGQKQVKKLLVKSSVDAPKVREYFQSSTWEKLKEAVNSIHQHQAVSHSLEELYMGVEGLCTHNFGLTTYQSLETELKDHLSSQSRYLETQGATQDDSAFLISVNRVWKDHCQHLLLIRSIFLSLDRQIAAEASDLKPIWEMGLMHFRELVAVVPTVAKRVKRGLLKAIESDRNSEVVDRALVKSLVRMYISLETYHSEFEPSFLAETEAYYVAESGRLTQEIELAAYLTHVENRLEFEQHTIGLNIAPSSVPLLLETLRDVLINRQLATFIISKGLDDLVDGDNHSDLRRAYRLVSLVTAQKPLRMAWNQYIKRRGSELVNDRSKDKTMIEELLSFRARMDKILVDCFENDEYFQFSLKDGFESAVNSRMNAPGELLARFMDRHLQAGSRISTSDVEFDHLFEKVMSVFRALNSKDVFEAFYRKDLAKRLLLNKCASIDAERVVLGKLKDECGAQYISKMEGMFKDIDLSRDLTTQFTQSLTDTPNPLIGTKTDIGIHVLTTSYWPTFNPMELKLPSELAAVHQAFSDFYLKQFQSRHLVWLNSHGHVTLRAFFPKARKEVSVSTAQATVLLLFNDSPQISYSDIAAATGIKDADELKRTVLSLFAGQYKVLNKVGEASSSSAPTTPTNEDAPPALTAAAAEKKEIADTDMFQFNEQFTSKKVRIKINQIQLKDTKVEQQKTQEAVFQDRIGQVDAAIVRIMKTRKALHHNELTTEVINILKFPFQASDLKKRIEHLIDREFLARDKNDATLYNYLP